MLAIKNICVDVDDKRVLNKFSLDIDNGTTHVIMGPNGAGKSSLSKAIMGDKRYRVVSGEITFNGENLLEHSVDERSKMGIFLAMQSPMEIDGVSNQDFLRCAISSQRCENVSLYSFIVECEKALDDLKMDKGLIHRSLNVGFSGGEKKKNEVLQILLLKPKLIILDELDSGLDVDSVRIVAENIKKYKDENKDVSLLIITHLPKLMEYLKPDKVHVIVNGNLVDTGGYELAKEIHNSGYNRYLIKANSIDGEKTNE